MKKNPILFSYGDVKNAYKNVNNFYSYLYRSMKKNYIKQIKKGLYALVDPVVGEVYASKFQIASKLFSDSYFSYHEALEYYGLANQSFVSTFTYLTHVYVNDVEFDGVIYASKKEMCDLQIIDNMNQNGVKVVTLERALVDSINNPSLAGGLEEIEEAIKYCESLNIGNVIEMLSYYDKAFLYQKVGYLFEKYLKDVVPESFFDLCLSKVGKAKRYFETKAGSGKTIKKWNLIVPLEKEFLNDIAF